MPALKRTIDSAAWFDDVITLTYTMMLYTSFLKNGLPKIWECFSTPKHPLVYALDVRIPISVLAGGEHYLIDPTLHQR